MMRRGNRKARPSAALTAEAELVHREFFAHASGCRVCVAAGLGYGERCASGAGLWAAYIEAADGGPAAAQKDDFSELDAIF